MKTIAFLWFFWSSQLKSTENHWFPEVYQVFQVFSKPMEDAILHWGRKSLVSSCFANGFS